MGVQLYFESCKQCHRAGRTTPNGRCYHCGADYRDELGAGRHGVFRIGNKRTGCPEQYQAEPWETIVNIDLPNVLGNVHVNEDKTRAEKIEAFRQDLLKDFAVRGPMYHACEAIVDLLMEGKDVILMCWCAPLPCHGQVIHAEVTKLLHRRRLELELCS
jgi:hypothetical protein